MLVACNVCSYAFGSKHGFTRSRVLFFGDGTHYSVSLSAFLHYVALYSMYSSSRFVCIIIRIFVVHTYVHTVLYVMILYCTYSIAK